MKRTHTTQQHKALAELDQRLHESIDAALAASDADIVAAAQGNAPWPAEAQGLAVARAMSSALDAGVSEELLAHTFSRVLGLRCRQQQGAGHA
jgi:hypothetical protein